MRLSDQFQHEARSITSINFLRYSEKEWDKIAGNEFAYCNRLRASDYLALFKSSGFDVCRFETKEDEEAKQSFKHGFQVDESFCDRNISDLCATQVRVALKSNQRKDCGHDSSNCYYTAG